jgi:hypothetical protein
MYMNQEVIVEMEKRHESSLNSLNTMVDLCDKFLSKKIMPDTELTHVTLFYIAKFYKSLLSLRILIISGFQEDGRVILRTLLEATLNLIYISSEPKVRVKRFIEYQYVAWYRLMNQIDSALRK